MWGTPAVVAAALTTEVADGGACPCSMSRARAWVVTSSEVKEQRLLGRGGICTGPGSCCSELLPAMSFCPAESSVKLRRKKLPLLVLAPPSQLAVLLPTLETLESLSQRCSSREIQGKDGKWARTGTVAAVSRGGG